MPTSPVTPTANTNELDKAPAYRAVLPIVVASTFLALTAYTGPLGNAVTITKALGASVAGRTWILASMSVGLAVALLPSGVIADRIGRRTVFQIGATLFVLADLACAIATSSLGFVIARIVAGAGAAGMIATGLGLIASTDPGGRHQATTATWWSVAMGGGIAAGPVLAGLLDLADAWRLFYVALSVGGAATALGARALLPTGAPTEPSDRKPDLVGGTLLVALLTALISAIVDLRTGADRTTWMLFVASAALLVLLVISQRVGTRRLVEPQMLTERPFIASTLAGFGTGLGVVAVMAFAPTFLVVGLGLSTLKAGATTTLWSATSAVAALLLRRFAPPISGTTQLVVGLLGVSVGMVLASGVHDLDDRVLLYAGLLTAGVASGLLNSGLARQAVATVPPAHAATGTAANNTARYFGAAIGVSAASIMASSSTMSSGWKHASLSGVAASLITAALVAALSRRSRLGILAHR